MATILHEQRQTTSASGASQAALPPLENGDRLTRAAFYDRWDAMPQLKHAERIEGEVYMQAAVRFEQHGHPHSCLVTWLGNYEAHTPGTEAGDNSTVQLDPDNDIQPDCFLRIALDCGGQSTTTEEGYVGGAPELVAEIAASSASYDLHNKLHVYRRNGVREYIVWKVLEREVAWFELHDDTYRSVQPDDNGLFQSAQFPGLWLDSAALIDGHLAQVLKTLQTGIETDDHAKFIQRLSAKPVPPATPATGTPDISTDH